MVAKVRFLGDIAESSLIRRLSRILGPAPEGMIGIGDDAAVLPQVKAPLVVSTDTLVEGTHFRPGWLSPRDLGRRAMAIAASDLPAMGASPLGAVVALNLPQTLPLATFDGLLRGLGAARQAWNLPVVGGNLARSRELAITVTLWGELSGKPFLRSGARPGQWVFVTGVPGWAHLGLELLSRYAPSQDFSADPIKALARRFPGARQALEAWTRPVPRFDVVERLRLLQPQGVLDTSDSLAQTLRHLLGKNLDIDLAEPRIPKNYGELAAGLEIPPPVAWFQGGEDYQLCFALKPALGERLLNGQGLGSIPVTFIGHLKEGTGKLRTAAGGLLGAQDFHHFG